MRIPTGFPHTALVVAISFINGTGFAGVIRLTGEDPCYWETRSLVVAQVVSLKRHPTTGLPRATLRPVMTLAGSFNCGSKELIQCPYSLNGLFSAISNHPLPGAQVVAILQRYKKGFFISGDIATYMPNREGIFQIQGLEDRKVEQVFMLAGKRRRRAAKVAIERNQDCKTRAKRTLGLPHLVELQPYGKLGANRNVLYARVISAPVAGKQVGPVFRLQPLGTIAGFYDSALQTEIKVSVPKHIAENKEVELPSMASTVIAVVDQAEGQFSLAEKNTDFMPSGQPILSVGESTDELIDSVLSNLRASNRRNKTDDSR